MAVALDSLCVWVYVDCILVFFCVFELVMIFTFLFDFGCVGVCFVVVFWLFTWRLCRLLYCV